MNDAQILYPILAHIFLVLCLYIVLGLRKTRAKDVDYKNASLNNRAWPPNVIQVSNNIANQFESPMLFYALCVVTHLAGASNIAAVSLAWTFVFLRYFHAYVHIGSNNVPYRFRSFLLSILIILALLIQTSVQIIMKVST